MQGTDSSSPITTDSVTFLLESYNQPANSVPAHLFDLQLVKSILRPDESDDAQNVKRAAERVLARTIGQLKKDEHSKLLQKRFIDAGGISKSAFGTEINKSIQTVSRREKDAIEALTQLLNHKEHEEKQAHYIKTKHILGAATYTNLFGDDRFWKSILTVLLSPNNKWITVVTGIGGIGKSSQTHQAISAAIRQAAVNRLIRIDAKNQKLEFSDFLSQMAEHLVLDLDDFETEAELTLQIVKICKTTPYLIYIDGIEDYIADLLEHLVDFVNPTQIIITSRIEPADKSNIHYFQVPQLAQTAASELIIEAQQAVQQSTGEIAEENLQRIYEKVGGNPLALKLVGALLGDHSLSEVFEDLIEVNYPDTEKMYRRVYIKTWNSLHEDNQLVLTTFGVAKGIRSLSVEMLVSMTIPDIVSSKRELFDVLNFLKTHSLIDIDREESSEKTHYKIHNLTRSFLETDIIDWGK